METHEFEPESRKRSPIIWLATIIILGLLGAVGYLLSDLNQRKFRLTPVGNHLIVERGQFLPFGFEAYEPSNNPSLKKAYAPIPKPIGSKLKPSKVFEDRSELDHALFKMLAKWTQQALEKADGQSLAQAQMYLKRSNLVPSVSAEQLRGLDRMEADLAYKHGLAIMNAITSQLEQASREFGRAIDLGTSYTEEAKQAQNRAKEQLTRLGTGSQPEATAADPTKVPAPNKPDPHAQKPEKPLPETSDSPLHSTPSTPQEMP